MLRVINLSRTQPVVRNVSLIPKRYQQSSGPTTNASPKSTPGSSTNQSASKAQTSSSSSYPSGSTGGNSTAKAIIYGLGLGFGVTLLYAEYDNGPFRRKVESTLPLSSTILSGLDKVIDPVFGRSKKLTTIISEQLPDVSPVTDKLPDKNQIKKAGEQVKDAATAVYDRLPSQKQIEKASERAKDAINDAYDKLPEYKKVKGAVTNAADQVKSPCLHKKEKSTF